MGWWQTAKANQWKPYSQDEFAGLKNGFWCVIVDSNKFTTISVLFTPQQKMRHKEILSALKPQYRLLSATVYRVRMKMELS